MPHEEDEVELNPSDDNVLNKYKFAAQAVKTVLDSVIAKCQPDASVQAICKEGDEMILKLTEVFYKNHPQMKKGIAFPTSLNVNNIMCHYSPNTEDEILKEGDVVKINLGAHVDGFPAIVGHTLVIGATAEKPVTGRVADAMVCANRCFDAILKMLRPDEENVKVTEIVEAISADFNCKLIEGIECHRMAQHVYDCDKSIMFNANDEQKKRLEKCKFAKYEVWLIDVIVSTGEGKPRDAGKHATIYKRTDSSYQLKLKASRQMFHEISSADLNFPFNIRVLSDQMKARMAMNECIQHGLIQEFPVMAEKTGEYVVQVKSTILLMKNQPVKLVGPDFKASLFKSELKVKNEEAKKILNRSMKYE